jgi:hypothetical protein
MSDAPTTDPSTQDPVATPAPKTTAKRRASRARATKSAGKKVKCAGCGKDVVLDTETSVGGRPAIAHHSCSAMQQKFHAWWLATLTDPDAPAPDVTK